MINKESAEKIVELVGGKENIVALQHCATRLRLQLNDTALAKTGELEEMQDVLKIIDNGGQYQIVIGPAVAQMYELIANVIGKIEQTNNKKAAEAQKKNIVAGLFDILSGAFTPLLPCLAGVGMLKALILLLSMTGLCNESNQTYIILSAIQNSFFYFLPIFLGFTLSKKLEVNPYIGAVIGAALLEPTFINMAVDNIEGNFIGIPVLPFNYSSTVFPVLIAIALYSVLYKFLDKIVPKVFHIIVVPFLCILIIVPLTLIIFGPIGVYAGQFIADAISQLINFNAVIAGAIIGFIWIPIVIMGLHWAIIPICISNIAAGGDPILAIASACTFTTIGIAAGTVVRSKDAELRGVLVSGLIPAIFAGITEPILYGLLIRYKRTLALSMIISSVAGALIALFGCEASGTFWSIFTWNTYRPFAGYIIAGLGAVAGAFLLIFLTGYKSRKEE